MWFLDHAWLVPAVPAASFLVILLFGKRLPRQGSEVGVPAIGLSFILAVGVLVQWIHRVNDANGVGIFGGAEGEQHVAPVVHTFTWWQSGGVHFTAGTLVDGL